MSFSNLISARSLEQTWFIGFAIFGVHKCCFDAYIWIFFVVCSANNSLCYTSLVFRFIVFWAVFDILFSSKSKWIVFYFCTYYKLVVFNDHTHCCNDLNCFKRFWRFYYADTKDIVFVWFQFLVCVNYLQFLFVLIILEFWLIVCVQLRFCFLFFLLYLLYDFPVAMWEVHHLFLEILMNSHSHPATDYQNYT